MPPTRRRAGLPTHSRLPGVLGFRRQRQQAVWVAAREGQTIQAQLKARRLWIVLDPTMRVMKVIPFAADRSDIAEFLSYVDTLPPPGQFAGFELQAPILVLPNVFEPELCQRLIGLYEAHGGTESGFMREVNGKTIRCA
jgi:hypothetical protein